MSIETDMGGTEVAGSGGGKEAWIERHHAQMRERDAEFTTISGMEVPLVATPADADVDHDRDLGYPGEYPFTRGPYPNMYRGRLWTMRQFAGFGSCFDTNQRFKYLLEHGQTGLSTAFDMPTLMGYDSDSPRSLGEVGRCGVAISSLDDMQALFDGIPLDQVSVSMTINGPAAVIFAFFVAAGKAQGHRVEALSGTLQNDVLKEYQAQKEFLFPPAPSMRLVTDVVEFCTRRAPRFHPISISGYHIREAGSTALQELAFTLANGFTYVEDAMRRGLDVDEFAPRLSFFWNSHLDFFEEIAKFRAARRIWARHMRERYRADRPESWRMRFHTQTAGCSLTAQQPENNIVRTTCQALAAVLGGTQSLHTNSMDETLALPTERAVKIALRTQQIIAEEIGVTCSVDPLGGSYLVESLTNRMEEGAERIFRDIDLMGGVVAGIEKGYFQREIGKAAARYQHEVDREQRTIVGVNMYVEEEKERIPILRIDESIYTLQEERLAALRSRRDRGVWSRGLDGLRAACRSRTNTIEALIAAAEARATLGEIVEVLKREFGEYREPPVF